MKNLICIIIGLFLSLGVFSQDNHWPHPHVENGIVFMFSIDLDMRETSLIYSYSHMILTVPERVDTIFVTPVNHINHTAQTIHVNHGRNFWIIINDFHRDEDDYDLYFKEMIIHELVHIDQYTLGLLSFKDCNCDPHQSYCEFYVWKGKKHRSKRWHHLNKHEKDAYKRTFKILRRHDFEHDHEDWLNGPVNVEK